MRIWFGFLFRRTTCVKCFPHVNYFHSVFDGLVSHNYDGSDSNDLSKEHKHASRERDKLLEESLCRKNGFRDFVFQLWNKFVLENVFQEAERPCEPVWKIEQESWSRFYLSTEKANTFLTFMIEGFAHYKKRKQSFSQMEETNSEATDDENMHRSQNNVFQERQSFNRNNDSACVLPNHVKLL